MSTQTESEELLQETQSISRSDSAPRTREPGLRTALKWFAVATQRLSNIVPSSELELVPVQVAIESESRRQSLS